ncbi:MAG TPA: class I SAM-dependent methyltransferase [Thermoanaerobaculia bacterium]|nr:class I SAM-dependent methyltransferase [Thermoanaerobaculia bacterium]
MSWPLDYPTNPTPRYGHGRPWHGELESILAARQPAYAELLDELARYAPEMAGLAVSAAEVGPGAPFWANDFLPALDAVSLSYLLATRAPGTYLEVGSGESTKFAHAALRGRGAATRVVSIDPQPRAEIDALCDTVIRSGLEDAPAEVYEALPPGDVLFFDGSHRVGMSSDVAVFFLEVLPRLAPGVLVQIHDIYWPADHPAEWAPRHYSEQYVLAACLLAAPERYEVILPNAYVCQEPSLRQRLEAVFQPLAAPAPLRHGQSFWFTKRY